MQNSTRALVLASFIAAPAFAQCTPPLVNALAAPLNIQPRSIATADFNLDGMPDLLVCPDFGTIAQVFLAQSSPAHTPAYAAPIDLTGGLVNGVAVADINGDGRPDVITVGIDSSNARIFLNALAPAPAGTFQAPLSVAFGSQTFSVATGDFNLDGRSDIVVSRSNSGLAMRLNTGNNTFGPATPLIGGSQLVGMVVADFNGDGRPDLVSARGGDGNGVIDIAINALAPAAPGTLSGPSQNLPLTGAATGIAGADVNTDGRVDLAVSDSSGGVWVFLATGSNPYFQAAGTFYPTGTGAGSVAFGDINNDSRPDLLVTNKTAGTLSLLLGRADGTFNPAVNYTVGGQAWAATATDALGDGRTDIAIATQTPNGLTLLRNAPTQFQPTSVTTGAGGTATFEVGNIPAGATIRWRHNGTPLSDGPFGPGGTVSGAATTTLQIASVGPGADGSIFDAVVTDACSITRSDPAGLRVAAPAACRADVGSAGGFPGSDGLLDNNDFIVFINDFFNHTGCD